MFKWNFPCFVCAHCPLHLFAGSPEEFLAPSSFYPSRCQTHRADPRLNDPTTSLETNWAILSHKENKGDDGICVFLTLSSWVLCSVLFSLTSHVCVCRNQTATIDFSELFGSLLPQRAISRERIKLLELQSKITNE